MGEFILIVCFAYPIYRYTEPPSATGHQTVWWEFVLPAFLDWADVVFMTLGLAESLTTLTPLIRSMVVPLACLGSRFLLQSVSYSTFKLLAVALIVCGTSIAGLGLADHTLFLSVGAVVALCLSVVCKAFQVVLAERLFNNDSELTVLDLAVNTVAWKSAMVLLTLPFFAESNLTAWSEALTNPTLMKLIVVAACLKPFVTLTGF